MRELIGCLIVWLKSQRDEVTARELAIVLAEQSLKRVDSEDATQMNFDAQELASACHWAEADSFEAAKRKVERARLATYLDGRKNNLEQFFRNEGHSRAIRILKTSSPGRRRAQWSLEGYDLNNEEAAATSMDLNSNDLPVDKPDVVIYDYIEAGNVAPSWIGGLMLGTGKFPTRSLRGVVWLISSFIPVLLVFSCAILIWLMLYGARPVQTRDIATVAMAFAIPWALWRITIRPSLWLIEDRLIPASEILVSWREEQSQLELTKENGERMLGLVRYSGTCLVCAAVLELRYGEGNHRRRLFGRCIESPQEHVFTFDRITWQGRAIPN